MIIGVCRKPEEVPAVAGLGYVEPTVGDLLCPREDPAAFERRLASARAAPLPSWAVNVLFPREMRLTGPQIDPPGMDAYIQTVCRRAGRAGVRIVVFGSGASRRAPEGFAHAQAVEQIIGHLKRWAPMAEGQEVRLVVEPLNRGETNLVNSLDEGAEIVRRVNHPAVRLLADTYHMALEDESPDAILRAGGLIIHAHCAEKVGRLPVGFGGEDHRPYFRALKKVGYDAWISIEAAWKDFAAELPRAVEELRRQLDG